MLTKEDVLEKLSNIKDDAKALGFERIGIFGSVSKDSFSSISDIDIAVVSNKEITGSGFEYLERVYLLKESLYKLFKRPLDIYDLNRNKRSSIRSKIEQEVIYV